MLPATGAMLCHWELIRRMSQKASGTEVLGNHRSVTGWGVLIMEPEMSITSDGDYHRYSYGAGVVG